MPIFSAQDLREKFLKYFQSKDHKIIPSASLIPDNDPTVLFTTAGMHPLVPYLMGEKHPQGSRLVSVQKCVRTSDIDEVGDNTHHTFFEMLGNWSLGDYGKKEAIEYSWEFLTKILKLDEKKLAITIFGGNEDVKQYDQEAEKIWLDIGVPANRIAKISDNWWGPAGLSGPCGPDTEMFYWVGQGNPTSFDPEDKNWVEIWNDVFMEYNKTSDKKFEPLKQKNIDTGMGFERTLAVLNNVDDNYRTELFWTLIQTLEKLAGQKYEENKKSFRIIADHIRSAVFIMGDERGISPSNKDQGYVVRRLVRRAIRFGKELGIENNFTVDLAKVIINQYQDIYSELNKNSKFILDELQKEENKFKQTLEKGLKEFNKFTSNYKGSIKEFSISVKDLVALYQTYGFPIEMSFEELDSLRISNGGIAIQQDVKDSFAKLFKDEMLKHQDLSRTASAGMFKGGLADDKENTKKHHTAAHLLLQALRQVLKADIAQKGSNINEERVRFDFSYADKLTPEQIKQVEDLVNEQIQKKLTVTCQEMTLAEAKKYGALGSFEEKYGDKVKVYTVEGFSKEICGGPHVSNTSELGEFKIIKEESSSAGVRRIKAVLK
ncbi:MAG: alanine--tRNA ligase [Patescibacteria group bacterium]|jgi:alanyl-tRNA synthetase